MTLKRLANPTLTNFYYSFVFLPREKRRAIEAVYAFARRGDDIVDGSLPPEEAGRRIALYRSSLDRCYSRAAANRSAGSPAGNGAASGPSPEAELQALAEAVRRFKVPRQYFDDLVKGLEMDLCMNGRSALYETFEHLAAYCYRVAGTIGLISIEIFGYRNPSARDYALNLGTALQLVNILRDLQADARRDRVYLPRQDLERFGVRPADLADGRYSDSFAELMQFECDRARKYFAAARRNLAPVDHRAMVAAEIMAAIYWRLLRKIERRRYNVFGERVRLSRPQKFWTALSVYLGRDWQK